MGMKKHGSKKEALPLENNKKEPQRLTWKSKYEQICASHVTNGTEEPETKDEDETKTNALDGLSGYLSSDSSSGESELNEEVQNFLKEVETLYEEDKKKQSVSNAVPSRIENVSSPVVTVAPAPSEMTMQYEHSKAPTVAWQECYDSTTGYTYYWNMETNEVTWDMPPDYQSYMEALKQWQQYQAQGVAALLQARVHQQLQQQQQLLAQQAQEQAASKAEIKHNIALKNKKKSLEKQSDSEEEKIELITSYGPFSEEESSDAEQVLSKTPKTKKKKTDSKNSSPKPSMGPQLPPGGNKIIKTMAKVIEKTKAIEKSKAAEKPKILTNSLVPYHPEFDDSDNEEPLENSKLNLVPDNGPPGAEVEKSSPALSPKEEIKKDEPEKVDGKEEEDDENVLLDRLKSQTQVLKELGGEIPDEVKSIITETSDKDEVKADDQKCRSPLLEESKTLKLKLSARAKKLISASTTTAKARATDFIQTPDGLKPISKKKEEAESSKNGTDGGEKRKLWLGMPTSLLSNDNNKNAEVRVREEGNRGGFGFVPTSDGKKRLKTDRIAFVKADILHLSEEENKANLDIADDEPLEQQVDIKDISGVLLDKMKFLSECKEPVPPVQTWTIQLETLLSAWESKNLRRNFLEDWLTKTSKELESLETSVAPDGWVCEWQRYVPIFKHYQQKFSFFQLMPEFTA